MQKKQNREGCAAFTLIEMMVVVAIIGILIAGVFRLLSAAGSNNQRAETVSKIERLQNALSGFYAEYGTYPPVGQYTLPDPFASPIDDFGQSVDGSTLNDNKAAELACRSQPMAFEAPYVQSLDPYINAKFNGTLMSVNTVLGGLNWDNKPEYKWCDPANQANEVKLFKFGALSFLLPRVEVMCSGNLLDGSSEAPKIDFFKSKQWKVGNAMSKVTAKDDLGVRRALEAQRTRENQAMARWLPNFEGIILGGKTLLGIETADRDHGYPWFSAEDNNGKGYKSQAGSGYVLAKMTIRDGWDRELYYYSAPPYQSYRVWSAGADGKTFPPWIPLTSVSGSKDRLTITSWVADDLVRFDH